MNTAETDLAKEKLKDFLINLTGNRKVSYVTRLVVEGVVDSLDFVQLIFFIEREFKINLNPLSTHIEDFTDIGTLADFIIKKVHKKGDSRR